MTVVQNISRIREAKGVSKAFLAKKLEMSPQNYGRIEAGETRLDVERLKTIAKALDVDSSIFFDRKLTDNVITEHE